MYRRACLGMALALSLGACGATQDAAVVKPPRSSTFPQPGHIVPLLTLNNPRLAETADLIARTGDEREKRAAARHLVQLAEAVASDAWRDSQRGVMARVNPRPGLTPTEGQTTHFLDDWQERHLVRVYDAMKAIGGDPVLDHCRGILERDDHRQAQQRLAFAVLAAHGRATRAPEQTWGMPAGPGARHLGLGPSGPTTYPGAPVGTYGGAGPAPDPSRGGVRASAPPQVTGGTIANVADVSTALQPYFVICYERALAEFGRFGGWITVDARVVSNGHVANVVGRGDDGMPISMVQCLEGVVKQALFAPPRGGDALVSMPWSFLPPATMPP